MRKIYYPIIISVSPIFFYFIVGIIFNGDHRWILSITLTFIFLFSLYLLKQENEFKYALLVGAPIVITLLATSIYVGFTRSILYLIFIPISILSSWILFKRKSTLLNIITAIALFALIGFVGFPNSIVFQTNQGARTNIPFKGIELVNDKKENIVLDESKIIVLDFWTTSCSACFKKFPELEYYYLKYKTDPNIRFYSINIPLSRDSFENTIELVNKLNYDFPTLYATSTSAVKDLDIHFYPHLTIVKDGKIRYNGRLETEDHIFVNHLNSEIQLLLKE